MRLARAGAWGCGLMLSGLSACVSAEPGAAAEALVGPTARELVLLEEVGPPVVSRLDLESGEIEGVFEAPSLGYVYELEGDAEGLLFSYTAPPSLASGVSFDRSAIVRLGASGGVSAVVCADVPGVWCGYPAASEASIWYVESGPYVPEGLALKRLDRASGQSEVVQSWATEPAVSPSGARVAWVGVDAESGARSLVIAEADGSGQRVLVDVDVHYDLGLPFFSADGESVFYVALEAPELAWMAWLLEGVLPSARAHASHTLPGDWWSVPAGGGAPTQRTAMGTIQYDGRADLGGEWIFVATREGVARVHLASGLSESLVAGRAFRAVVVR